MSTRAKSVLAICLLAVLCISPLSVGCKSQRRVRALADQTAAMPSGRARKWVSTGVDHVTGLFYDSSGSLLVCGSSAKTDNLEGAFVLKYSPAGELVWQRLFTLEKAYIPAAVKTDDEGNVYVTGNYGNPDEQRSDVFLLKLSSEGEVVWSIIWGTPDADEAKCLCVSKHDILVGGSANGAKDALLLRYSSDGILLAAKSWRFDHYLEVSSVHRDDAGNLYVAGSGSTESGQVTFIAKYSPEEKPIWQHGLEDSSVSVMALDGSGNVYIGGATAFAVYLAKVFGNGKLSWCKTWRSGMWDTPTGIALLDNDTVYLSGLSSGEEYSRMFLLKYASDGRLVWQKAVTTTPAASHYWAGMEVGPALRANRAGDAFLAWSGATSPITEEQWENINGSTISNPSTFVPFELELIELTGKESSHPPVQSEFNARSAEKETEEAPATDVLVAKVHSGSWQPEPTPESPKEFRAAALSATEAQVTWAFGRFAEAYIVERKPKGESAWEQAGLADWSRYPFKDSELQADTTYVYRMKAYNYSGVSTPSAECEVTTFYAPDGSHPGIDWVSQWVAEDYATATACIPADDGGMIVAGAALGAVILAKLSSEGRTEWKWNYTYFVPENSFIAYTIKTLARGPQGNIIATGEYEDFAKKRRDILLMKFSASGALLWSRTWGSEQSEMANGVATDERGNIIVAGTTYGFHSAAPTSCNYTSVFLLKYSPYGKKLWQVVYGDDYSITTGDGLAVDKDGNAYLAGWYLPFHYELESGALIAQFSPDGELVRHRRLEMGALEAAKALALDEQGNLYVVGSTQPTL